jgi:uncharacterized protein (TIGR00251 family)
VASLGLAIREGRHGVILKVRLTPKSSRDEILGLEEHAGELVLKARVRAVPANGLANQALERLIARWLGLPPSSVGIARGGKSRLKEVAIDGNDTELADLIAGRLAGLPA